MWLSLLVGIGFSVVQAITVDSEAGPLEMLMAAAFIGLTAAIYQQVSKGHNWARLLYLVWTILSYGLFALDPMGLSKMDLATLLVSAPLDIFAMVRLFSPKATEWFLAK
jgi:hypothetical protein